MDSDSIRAVNQPLTSLEEEAADADYEHDGYEDVMDETDETSLLLSDVSDVEHLRLVLRLTSFSEEPDDKQQIACFYYIHVCAEALGGRTWFVRKRYSQFDALRKQLKRVVRHPPDLPGKDVVKRMLGIQNLRKRATGLSTFLWRVAGDPQMCDSKPVRQFLFSDIVRSPPANVHPTTPLISSMSTNFVKNMSTMRYGESAAATASAFSLDSQSSSSFRMRRQSEVSSQGNKSARGDEWADDMTSDDGRLFLGKSSTADELQRGFASEGLAFADADIHNGSGSDDHSEPSDWGCSIFPFGRSKQHQTTSKRNGASSSAAVPHPLQLLPIESTSSSTTDEAAGATISTSPDPFPSLRIVIMLVGSRGDVQPYVALGKTLKTRGHSVRIAAHECFREWIEVKHGLQFAPIAGDPKELLRMVVENKMFSYNFVKNGLTNHRAWVSQVLEDCWNACTQEDPYNIHPPIKRHSNLVGPGHAFTALDSKYRADLIIANPPSFAGWHCAEALGVPLLMSFPMPWTRTTEFPSPFTSLSAITSPASMNWMSYGAVDRLIWLGLGDLINAFRVQTLGLHPIWTLSAKGHRYIHDYQVPWLYCWSPSVLKQPHDWLDHILVSGYFFLDDSDGADWQPDEVLTRCFDESDPRKVVFIGFGSIVVKDPDRLSELILTAANILVEKGFKVLVQKGWAGVEFDPNRLPKDGIFLIGAAPHSWIFARCAVVVHHGGSGTTAEGLRLGIPTVVVPFFGDQFFWGETVLRRGLGDYEPYTSLTPLRLVECVMNCMQPQVREKCTRVTLGIKREDGTKRACDFIEKQVMGFDGFDELIQDEDWRKYPYYDLKKRIKNERYENVQGFRKYKSRVKSLGSFLSSSSTGSAHVGRRRPTSSSDRQLDYANGVEMNRVTPLRPLRSAPAQLSSNNNTVTMDENYPFHKDVTQNVVDDFPFLPEIYPGKVPDGHTAYSWFGTNKNKKKHHHLGLVGDQEEEEDIPVGHTKFTWTASTW